MPNGGTLYVFLHGLSVVAERANDLLVVLPKVPGHVYKAGNWLAETQIAPAGVLRLRGVRPGNVAFSQTNFCIHLPGTSLTRRKRAASLLLPRPKEILGLLLAENTPYVARTKSGALTFDSLATVPVLVYDYGDENEVLLEGHYWETSPIGASTSLHIISTSEEQEGQEHEEETEDVLHRVLRNYPGVEYRSNPRPLAAAWIDPLSPMRPGFGKLQTPNVSLRVQGEHVIEGTTGKLAFALAELEYPTLRLARLARLGRLKRGKLPIGSLWRSPDPIFERLSNCGTITTP